MSRQPIDLRAFANRYRLDYDPAHRGRADDPRLLIMPGRFGHIYAHGHELLGVATGRSLGLRLAKLPGVEIWQEAEDGMNLVFPPEAFAKVARIVKPKRRRQSSETERQRLAKYAFRPAIKCGKSGQNRVQTTSDVFTAV